MKSPSKSVFYFFVPLFINYSLTFKELSFRTAAHYQIAKGITVAVLLKGKQKMNFRDAGKR